jgi:hypothetical protein
MVLISMSLTSQTILNDSSKWAQPDNYPSIDPGGNFYLESGSSTFMGNRGNLRNCSGRISRKSRSMAWIACDFKRKNLDRAHLRPVKYTRLFFFDEVTALTAGHRPCGLCRGADLQKFKNAILVDQATRLSTREVDRALRNQCCPETRRLSTMRVSALPIGSMFKSPELSSSTYVKGDEGFLIWNSNGYIPTCKNLNDLVAVVITPKIIIHAYLNGYRPCFHHSAY